MFDIVSTEFLLIVIVAVIVIGPKDLPRALYKVGQVVGKARGMARHFRTGIDAMIREAELEELEKKWAAQNQRILEEHPATDIADSPAQEMTALPAPDLPAADLPAAPEAGVEPAAASVPAAAPGAPKDGAPT